jgi:hypothetical protein
MKNFISKKRIFIFSIVNLLSSEFIYSRCHRSGCKTKENINASKSCEERSSKSCNSGSKTGAGLLIGGLLGGGIGAGIGAAVGSSVAASNVVAGAAIGAAGGAAVGGIVGSNAEDGCCSCNKKSRENKSQKIRSCTSCCRKKSSCQKGNCCK